MNSTLVPRLTSSVMLLRQRWLGWPWSVVLLRGRR